MMLELLVIFFFCALLGFFLWALFGLILMPIFGKNTVTYCFSHGDGEDLEKTVRAYSWLRDGKRNGGSLVLVDCGLSAEGLDIAERLRKDRMWLKYCPYEALTDYTQLLQQCLENSGEL